MNPASIVVGTGAIALHQTLAIKSSPPQHIYQEDRSPGRQAVGQELEKALEGSKEALGIEQYQDGSSNHQRAVKDDGLVALDFQTYSQQIQAGGVNREVSRGHQAADSREQVGNSHPRGEGVANRLHWITRGRQTAYPTREQHSHHDQNKERQS